ncbi:energy transducer TonB [Marinilabilia rubra]|nr:energy transducer TonB [Marinilabilia rubra]
MNKAQRKSYCAKLKAQGVRGIIKSEYASEKGLKSDQPVNYTVLWLSESGQPLKVAKYDPYRVMTEYETFHYDDQGKLKEKNYYEPDGSLSWKETFYYDAAGELIEAVEYTADGALDARKLNVFNDQGFLYKTRELNPDDELTFFRIARFNDDGSPVYITLRHAKGFTMSSEKIKYDANGLPEEKVIAVGLRGEPIREKYEHDNHGLIETIREFRGNKVKSLIKYRYFAQTFESHLRRNAFQKVRTSFSNVEKESAQLYVQKASFPGGDKALKNYLNAHVKYPDEETKQGVVEVKFEVKSNGKIRRIEIHRGISETLDGMAEELIKDMPEWVPARETDGKTVDSEVIVPVPFLK